MSTSQPARSSARQILLQAEDQYNKRIDDDITKLVDCFTDVIRVGEVCLRSACRTKTRISSGLQKKDIKSKVKVHKLCARPSPCLRLSRTSSNTCSSTIPTRFRD